MVDEAVVDEAGGWSLRPLRGLHRIRTIFPHIGWSSVLPNVDVDYTKVRATRCV